MKAHKAADTLRHNDVLLADFGQRLKQCFDLHVLKIPFQFVGGFGSPNRGPGHLATKANTGHPIANYFCHGLGNSHATKC